MGAYSVGSQNTAGVLLPMACAGIKTASGSDNLLLALARLIGERDQAQRSAALSSLEAVYKIEGQGVHLCTHICGVVCVCGCAPSSFVKYKARSMCTKCVCQVHSIFPVETEASSRVAWHTGVTVCCEFQIWDFLHQHAAWHRPKSGQNPFHPFAPMPTR